jgi:hypothetical protein
MLAVSRAAQVTMAEMSDFTFGETPRKDEKTVSDVR